MAKAKTTTRTPATIAEMGEALHEMTQTVSKPSDNSETFTTLLYDAQRHYEQRIFWTRAESPEDAIIQLARVSAELDAFDYEEEGCGKKWLRLNRDIEIAPFIRSWRGLSGRTRCSGRKSQTGTWAII